MKADQSLAFGGDLETIDGMDDVGRVLTWAALLAKWTDFAKSALALPREGEGGKLRQAVPAVIGLQAVTQALAELDCLPESERAVGIDRAEIMIRRFEAEVGVIWAGGVPREVGELVADAKQALGAAKGQ